MKWVLPRAIWTLVLTLIPILALAHSEHVNVAEAGAAFMIGLTHPVLGLDHLAAMLSVGILSAQMAGKAIWTVPITFVMIMLVGGILGMVGIPLFSVELGIACSVLVLGVAIAADKKLPPIIAMVFVGFFGLFHGHAHGTEMPFLSQPEFYAYGFITGTSAIHICGVLLGIMAEKLKKGRLILRIFGATIAAFGLYLVVANRQ